MTLLIKNAQPLGCPHALPPRVDIFISGDKISAFGNFPAKGADEVIDSQGAYLSPGFIDVNTDSDHYLTLFENPSQEDFLKQGVTTIIGGQCGASLAPLLYGSLESIRKWADIDRANVNWHTLKEFLEVLEKRPLGVNFGTLIGHSTIRRAIAGDSPRNLTRNELKVFAEILKRGLAEGGFGLSTGLGYAHGRTTPPQEIKFLLRTVQEQKGVYATHLRKSGVELKESVGETLKMYNDTGVKTLISHFLPHFGEEKEYEEALEKFQHLPGGEDFHFDLYPFDTSLVPLYTFLPSWAQNRNLETMNALLQDEWQRSKIMKDLAPVTPEHFIIAQAPKNDSLVGHSLQDLKEIYETKDPKEALCQLMLATKLLAMVSYKNINQALIKAALCHPRSLIASGAASFPEHAQEKILKPERATSTFTKLLSLVEQETILSLEEAIVKMSVEPAKKFNLKGRGELKEGALADLVIFKNQEIKYVVVNGRMAVKEGVFQGICAGRVLRHNQ